MILVLDASVALNWFLDIASAEPDSERAVTLLAAIRDGSIAITQPVHFVAEVAAVLAREKPEGALADLVDLLQIDFCVVDSPEAYATALDLSIRYRQHLFDSLYHAVALQVPGATLVTADRRYYAKAWREGRIVMLADWNPIAEKEDNGARLNDLDGPRYAYQVTSAGRRGKVPDRRRSA